MTYLSDGAYDRVINAILLICPLLERGQIIDHLASRNIWPESTRPDDEAGRVVPFQPALIHK